MSETPSSPDGDALEEAIAAFRQMPVPERPGDDEMLARLAGTRRAGRFRMRQEPARWPSRRAILSSAAAAVLCALCGWFLLGQSTTVALADVIQAAQKHRLVRYKQMQIIDEGQRGDVAPDRTVLADLQAFRVRSETRVREKGLESDSVVIQDARKNRLLMLSTDTDLATGKVVTRVGHLEKMPRPNDRAWEDFRPLGELKPYQPLLERLRELQNHKATTAAKEFLDGRETVTYRLEDDSHSILVWVDPETKLPVRMENAATYPDGVRYRFAFTNFEWDPEVKDVEQLFSTEPPEGYTIRDHTREDERGRTRD